jgi:acetyl-CoA carboxylase biotin carboxyl carrier protein
MGLCKRQSAFIGAIMPESETNRGDVFDEHRLQRLVALMKEHGLSEVELRDSDQQIRICRPFSEVPPGYPHYPPGGFAAPPLAAPPAASPSASAATPETESDSIVLIKSPMVGTFYSRPNPNSPPFLKVGGYVEPESTVCIIEAMKVFNEIPAEIRGRIVAILVDDEEPVEFGKPLYRVDTKG